MATGSDLSSATLELHTRLSARGLTPFLPILLQTSVRAVDLGGL